MANFETYSVLEVVTDTGNLDTFKGLPPKSIVKFLRRQFKSGKDQFIKGSVLERINYRRIKLKPLAACLSGGGDKRMLDILCDPRMHFEF